MYRKNLSFCLTIALFATAAVGAPRGSKSKTNYDQKQTGDYNIRLNLKDFQIVAIVDDSLGDLGSYDYNYDYSELTVKPGSVSTPASTEQSSASEESSTAKPTSIPGENSSLDPFPLFIVSNHPNRPSVSVELPLLVGNSPSKPSSTEHPSSSTEKSTEAPSSSTQQVSSTTLAPQSSTEKFPSSTSKIVQESPDKIPVFVQPVGFLKDGLNEKKGENPVTSLSIVPSEDIGQENNGESQAPLGEIMYYRKCAQGYARDKRGRCRKVRRPQFPFGFARLASNIAAKLRPTETDEEGPSTSGTGSE